MATRRSLRQANSKAEAEANNPPQESKVPDSAHATPSESKAAKPTRRKRAREEGDVNGKSASTPKRQQQHPQSTSKPTPVPASDAPNPTTSSDAQETFWLLKAEPESRIENGVDVKFSIDDLAACQEPEPWTGVRNYQARNNMMAMKEGDLAFFYHSNAKPPGVVGIMKIVKEATVDESAFDPKDPYYDPKSNREKPKWFNVHVEFIRKFPEIIDLYTLKGFAIPGGPLEKMQLVTTSRLSVSKVTKEEWEFILGLAEGKGGVEGEVGKKDKQADTPKQEVEKSSKKGRKSKK